MIMNKPLIVTMFCLVIISAFSSCKKDEAIINPSDEYFVKYAISGNGTYNYFSNFSVFTEKGNVSFSGYQYKAWSKTYGPVKKGFTASVSVTSSYVTVEIYVAKNNGSLVLKASKTGNGSPTLGTSQTYSIDF